MKKLFVVSVVVLSLLACSKDQTAFDGSAIEKSQKELYAKQFVEKYGEITPTKTWDLTNFAASQTRGTTDEIVTKLVNGLEFDFDYRISGTKLVSTMKSNSKNKALYDDMIKKSLPDGRMHKGEPVVLTAPSNSFTIYPLSVQGL